MSAHEDFADWDGAYVMGALTWAERQQYEEHLAACPLCAEAVAELGPLPGLLARLAPEDAEPLLDPVPAELPDGLAARTLEASRVVPLSRRRTRVRIALLAAAAAVVAAAVVVPITLHRSGSPGSPGTTVALAQVVPNPLTATVQLIPTKWGTSIRMSCWYATTPGEGKVAGDRTYELYVLDAAGAATLVSSWRAGPGDEATTTGSTDLPIDDVAEVQLRAQDGTVLLSAPV
jgi:hypothetical protein